MIDIVLRDCGHGEWLPIIKVTPVGGHGRELYRGSRLNSREAAFDKAREVWDNDGTGNIAAFKRGDLSDGEVAL